MLDTTKTVINNINQFKFLRNIDRVTFKKDADTQTNNVVSEEGSKEKIMELQNNLRVNNLKVFANSYFGLRLYRFFVLTLPAIITAGAIGLLSTPSRVNRNDTATHYTKEESIYKFGEGVATETKDVYDLDAVGDFFGHKLISPENVYVEDGIGDKITFKIHDGETCITGSVAISSDGGMTASSAGIVNNYYDVDEYKDVLFQETEEDDKYALLFDRAVAIVRDSGYLSGKNKEILDALTASDKKEIVLSVASYENHGEAEVVLSKTRMPRKVLLIIIAIIYDLILALSYSYRKDEIGVDILTHENGKLMDENTEYTGSLWYSALKIKEAFLAAEKERILMLSSEIDKNVAPEDRNRLLTGYEKRLIKKANKNKDK